MHRQTQLNRWAARLTSNAHRTGYGLGDDIAGETVTQVPGRPICLLRDRHAVPPPRRPAQGAPPARMGSSPAEPGFSWIPLPNLSRLAVWNSLPISSVYLRMSRLWRSAVWWSVPMLPVRGSPHMP